MSMRPLLPYNSLVSTKSPLLRTYSNIGLTPRTSLSSGFSLPLLLQLLLYFLLELCQPAASNPDSMLAALQCQDTVSTNSLVNFLRREFAITPDVSINPHDHH